MANAAFKLVDQTALVQISGAELLAPLIATASQAAIDAQAAAAAAEDVIAAAEPALRLITDGDQTALALKDNRGRVLRAFTQDGGERGPLYSVSASDRPGVRFVDARGMCVNIQSAPPDPVIIPPAAIDTRPYIGPALYGVEGETAALVLSNVLTDRVTADRCLGMLLPSQGTPVAFRDQVTFDPEAVGPTVRLAVRDGDGAQIGESGDVDVRVAPNPGTGAPVILTLGDSIAYRGGLYWQNLALTGWGYTPTYVGTLLSYGATEGSTSGGKNGEVKPGHELGDFTYQTTALVGPLPPGDEATYDALGTGDKRLFNTLLRAPSGDPAGDIVNGQVIDFDFYFTRHGLTPATMLQLSLWTNDINALDEIAVYDRIYDGYSLLFRRWREYHATHPIVISLPGTARIPAREALWPRYIAAIRAVWQAVVDAGDPNIHLAAGWAQVPSDAGYDLTPASETPDALTGSVLRTIEDGVHPTGAPRVASWRLFAAAVAYAHSNIL